MDTSSLFLEDNEEEETGTALYKRGPGRMTNAEKRLKQECFAKMLLDPHQPSDKQTVMDALGISENTYYTWSKDPHLPRLAGHDLGVTDLKVRILASSMKLKALNALEEVMLHDKNGLARVRASEIILSQDTEMPADVSDNDKKVVAEIMTRFQPVLVFGNAQVLQQFAAPTPEYGDEEDVIDGEIIVDE